MTPASPRGDLSGSLENPGGKRERSRSGTEYRGYQTSFNCDPHLMCHPQHVSGWEIIYVSWGCGDIGNVPRPVMQQMLKVRTASAQRIVDCVLWGSRSRFMDLTWSVHVRRTGHDRRLWRCVCSI